MDYIEVKQLLAIEYAKTKLQNALIHNPTELPNNVPESDFFAMKLVAWYNDCYSGLSNHTIKDEINQ